VTDDLHALVTDAAAALHDGRGEILGARSATTAATTSVGSRPHKEGPQPLGFAARSQDGEYGADGRRPPWAGSPPASGQEHHDDEGGQEQYHVKAVTTTKTTRSRAGTSFVVTVP
jgi:hypothetical protein